MRPDHQRQSRQASARHDQPIVLTHWSADHITHRSGHETQAACGEWVRSSAIGPEPACLICQQALARYDALEI